MPLPLGHTAIGLAAFETTRTNKSIRSRLGLLIHVAVLANLPDIDILFGLLMQGNGAAYHRGPTHSLLFALLAGYTVTWMGRRWQQIPSLSFGVNTVLIFSHITADFFLTAAPVSLFWPLELNWSTGYHGWADVLNMALFQSLQDILIAVTMGGYLVAVRFVRQKAAFIDNLLVLAKSRIK